jgi:hypothetical protein
MKFNKEKTKQMIEYIAYKWKEKTGRNITRKELQQIMYFSDFNHYELYEESITGETYYKGAKPKENE